MLKTLTLPVLALLAACAAPQAQISLEAPAPMADQTPLTIERVYASPSLSGPRPQAVKYSPDGKRVTFLKARQNEAARFDLWQFDVATGEQSMLVDSRLLEPKEVELSEEEKALRERKRIAGRKGIVSYDWGTAETILVPIGGDLHLVTLGEKGPSARQLTDTDAFEYDAKVSPNGNYVSFVRDGAVYAIDLETSEESRLTPLAEPENAISYGVAEFVAQEEMSRYTGYWWSPDDRYIAYTRVDESTVDIIPRFDIAAEDVTVINQRYPRAGRPNAVVDLFVREIETGEVMTVPWRRDDWGPAEDQYMARVHWAIAPDMGADVPRFYDLLVERVGRDQTELELAALFGGTTLEAGKPPQRLGEMVSLGGDVQANWINLSHDFRAVSGDTYFWTLENSGFRHVVKTSEGDGWALVTDGDWVVDALEHVSPDGGTVYFTGYMDSPLERHLYRYGTGEDSDPYDPVLLTERGKSWSIIMAPDGESFVGTSSSPTQPAQTGLYRAEDGSLITWIEENPLDETHPYYPYLAEHTVPEFGTLTAEDGQTLHYSVQLPSDFDPGKKYPALVEVYGGPHVQVVDRDWERTSDQFYSRQGYIVFRLDNRGSANRGKAFEDVIYRQTGGPEVRDQLLGVEWLKSQTFVDADRIGIQGWSYGGYMVLMTILQAPEGTFAAAVAGAPVTDWSLYDTFYTERYMDTPQDNPDGYEKSSVFYHLDRLEGKIAPLLLIHGMADDNVTFDNTTRLMAELQEKGQMFELMTYPGQRHGIRGEALQVHLMKTRMAFLERKLKDK
ncbi:MAG: S9 family peptidase [Pseudomonadota bacterium]